MSFFTLFLAFLLFLWLWVWVDHESLSSMWVLSDLRLPLTVFWHHDCAFEHCHGHMDILTSKCVLDLLALLQLVESILLGSCPAHHPETFGHLHLCNPLIYWFLSERVAFLINWHWLKPLDSFEDIDSSSLWSLELSSFVIY